MKIISHSIKGYVYILIIVSSNLYGQEQKSWQWVEQLGGKTWDKTCGIRCDTKNNLYITGSYSDRLNCKNEAITSKGSQDIFIARFSENGNLKDLWNVGGKGRDEASCIALLGDGNVLIGGMITDTAVFGDLSASDAGPRLFITSMNEKGKFGWVTTLTPSKKAILSFIETDTEGSIYVSGSYTGSLTCNDMTVESNGKKDIFLAVFSETGTIMSLKTYGSEEDDYPTAITASHSGVVTLSGILGKTFAIGEQNVASMERAKANAFIVQLDKDLKAQWITTIAGKEYVQVASLGEDTEGNIYATGSYSHTLQLADTSLASEGYTDGFLLKYTPKGELQWGRSFGTWYYDYAGHLLVDNLGGALVTGSMGDTLTVDSLTVYPKGSRNSALAIQFSSEGKAIWADCISGNGRNFSNASAIDQKGNLYLAGSFRDKFDKENDGLTSRGDQDVFLAKYYNCPDDEHAEINGETKICPGSSTELSVKGAYRNIVWNDSIHNQNYLIVSIPGKYCVSMLDKRGCLQGDIVEVIQAISPVFSIGDNIQLSSDSALLLRAPDGFSNYCWQDGSMEETFLVKAEKETAGGYTYWLSAVDSMGCTVSDSLTVLFYNTLFGWIDIVNTKLTIYPNPVKDYLYWSLNTEKSCRMSLDITGENGKVVYEEYISSYQPGEIRQINIDELPYGMYYFHLKDGTGRQSQGFSIIKM